MFPANMDQDLMSEKLKRSQDHDDSSCLKPFKSFRPHITFWGNFTFTQGSVHIRKDESIWSEPQLFYVCNIINEYRQTWQFYVGTNVVKNKAKTNYGVRPSSPRGTVEGCEKDSLWNKNSCLASWCCTSSIRKISTLWMKRKLTNEAKKVRFA